ncbi:prepilin peptidase [Rothia nasimurium]|uniref:prepilin peptidase n=1 Tax=Rothia nasimurium TaxID=85336 RepID=UPI001F393BFD|nr:A24 family peptidase [Rothia nasimurium]
MLEQIYNLAVEGLGGRWQSALACVLLVWVVACYLVAATRLWVIDVREHRLPDRIVLPLYALLGLPLFGVILLASPDSFAQARQTAYGSAVMFGFYALMRLASRGALGLGDVKLAGVLGLLLAYFSPLNLLWGNLLIFLTGGLYSLALIVTRRATGRTHIAFGPFMLLGTTIALFFPAT